MKKTQAMIYRAKHRKSSECASTTPKHPYNILNVTARISQQPQRVRQ